MQSWKQLEWCCRKPARNAWNSLFVDPLLYWGVLGDKREKGNQQKDFTMLEASPQWSSSVQTRPARVQNLSMDVRCRWKIPTVTSECRKTGQKTSFVWRGFMRKETENATTSKDCRSCRFFFHCVFASCVTRTPVRTYARMARPVCVEYGSAQVEVKLVLGLDFFYPKLN